MTNSTQVNSSSAIKDFWKSYRYVLRSTLETILKTHLEKNKEILNNYIEISDLEKQNQLEQVIHRHGFWILWRDEARDEFAFLKELEDENQSPIYFGATYKPQEKPMSTYKELVYGPGYALASGKGSLGLGVRLGRSVCLRDTVRDLRGAVAFEDILVQNYSFMGIPIEAKVNKSNNEISRSHKPIIAIFCLLYPHRGAWHKPFIKTIVHQCNEVCLYEKVRTFVSESVDPVVQIIRELFESRAWSQKTQFLSQVGRKSLEPKAYREEMLKAIVYKQAPDNQIERDLLGFKTSVIYEKEENDPERCEELDELVVTYIKKNYASDFNASEHDFCSFDKNGSWKRIDLIGDKYRLDYFCNDTELESTIEDNIKIFWEKCVEWAKYRPEKLWGNSDIKMDAAILNEKWHEIVLSEAGNYIVGCLTKKSQLKKGIQYLFDSYGSETKGLPVLETKSNILCAMILGKHQWKLNIESKGSSEKVKNELICLPFSRNTIFRQISILKNADLLPGFEEEITVNLGNGIIICSDAWCPPKRGENLIDHSAYTALLQTCGDCDVTLTIKAMQKGTYRLHYQKEKGQKNSTVCEFDLITNDDDWHGIALDIKNEERIALSNTFTSENPDAIHQKTLLKELSKVIPGNDTNTKLIPHISKIFTEWQFSSNIQSEELKKACFDSNAFKKAAVGVIEAIHPGALRLDVNSYVFSPLWIYKYTGPECVGYLMLGSPRREYDKHDRITYSQAQLNAIKTFTDYFELTIAREEQTREAARKQREKEKADAIAEETGHLKGIEPEVRFLINTVNELKRAAERVARRIAPAEYGDLAFDADTIKLFREKSKLAIALKGYDNEKDTKTNLEKVLEDKQFKWNTVYSLEIREGTARNDEWQFNTIHRTNNIGRLRTLPEVWTSYRCVFCALGFARDNKLMLAFARKQINSDQEQFIPVLFNAAKLLFHRLHYPGENLELLFTVQLLAALLSSKKPIHVKINDTPKTKDYPCSSVEDFVGLILHEKIKLVDDTDCKKSQKLKLDCRVNDFVPAISRFTKEIEELRLINVTFENKFVEVTFCYGKEAKFDATKLHRGEVETGGLDAIKEHGLTSSVLTIEKGLGTIIGFGENKDYDFSYYLNEDNELRFFMRFQVIQGDSE
jgi:hypothetical protein